VGGWSGSKTGDLQRFDQETRAATVGHDLRATTSNQEPVNLSPIRHKISPTFPTGAAAHARSTFALGSSS
jgi:hypothetical protein